ncbi:MAG TPA: hypothetical protein VGG41_06845 [Solirubrobacteraceae bacterium]
MPEGVTLPDMDPQGSLRVEDLRAALDLVLARVEERFGSAFDLDADLYWEIGAEAAFDMQSTPVPNVGQLTDDLARLRELSGNGPGEDVLVWHDLARLVGIPRRIGALDLPAAH